MASNTNILLLSVLVLHLYIATTSAEKAAPAGQAPVPGKKYCVPKPNASDKMLQANIDYVCSKGVDCKPIQAGGACFEPNIVRSHAAFIMNSYYNVNGRNDFNCDFSKTGVLATQNPSYGNCVYL